MNPSTARTDSRSLNPPEAISAGVRNFPLGTSAGRFLRYSVAFFWLSLAFLVPCQRVWAIDPNKRISQYAHGIWRLDGESLTGVPTAIAQTADGYLWIGTSNGLTRFDGVRFVSWHPPHGQSLPSDRIVTLKGSLDGNLWIGTDVGLSRLFNGQLVNYDDAPGTILQIKQRKNGEIWFTRYLPYGQDGGLCQVTGTRTHCFGIQDDFPLSAGQALEEDSEGYLWSGDATLLVRWKSGFAQQIPLPGLERNPAVGVASLVAAKDGSLWVGSAVPSKGSGLLQMVHGILHPYQLPSSHATAIRSVSALLVDRDGSLWIGTFARGIYRIHDGKLDHFEQADGLSSDSVNPGGLIEDREGNIWVTTARGIDCFRNLPMVSYSRREGLTSDEVDSVLADSKGNVWVGGPDTLSVLRDGDIDQLTHVFTKPGIQITSMLEDHAGRIWIGVDDSLVLYQNGHLTPIKRSDGSPIGFVVGMTEDANQDIWLEISGHPRALMHLHGVKVVEIFPAPTMPTARKLAADPHDGVWLGLATGDLGLYRQGKLQVFPFLHSDHPGENSEIKQLVSTPIGDIFGATPVGVIARRNDKSQLLSSKNGLPCDRIFAIVPSPEMLWLYSQCGLVGISNDAIERWWINPDLKIPVKVFDILSGALPQSAPFNGGSRSPDGRLWFANSVALQMFAANRPSDIGPPLLVHIEALVIDRKPYSAKNGLRLPPNPHELEIDYTAPSFIQPSGVRFRYQLEGQDKDWQDSGTRRQAFYSDLSPGHYRFRVMTATQEDRWSNQGATLDFVITPAWYQTYLFRMTAAVFLAAAVWAAYFARVRSLAHSINERFDERLAERTRMARELHDTFLQTIQGSKIFAEDALEGPSDPERLRNVIQQLVHWLGTASEEGRATLRSLRLTPVSQSDLPETLHRAIESELGTHEMTSRFVVVGEIREIHAIVRDEIYRIGFEAIRNARTHSHGDQLAVELSYGKDFTLRVRDNGIGIEQHVSSVGKESHFGLQGMRERASRINGELDIAVADPRGTEVKLVVPGAISFVGEKQSWPMRLKALVSRLTHASTVDPR